MMGTIKTLYHVTLSKNLPSILQGIGISPGFSKGRLNRCYYVDKQHVEWAIAHCAARHHCDPFDLIVLRIKARAADFTGVNGHPFMFTQIVYKPYAVDSAVAWLKQSERVASMEALIEYGEIWPKQTPE